MGFRVFLFFFFCASSLVAQNKPEILLPNQGLQVIQRFSGPAKMALNDRMEAQDPPPLLITSQEDFQKFLGLLPLQEESKNAVPGPSRDPLVKAPRFDWNRLMLLVVFDSHSLSFPPNVSRIEVSNDHLTAYIEYPDTKSIIEAKPLEIGSYGAALVTKNDLPIQWRNPGRHWADPRPESPMIFLPNAKTGGE